LEDFREELSREDAFLAFAMARMLTEPYSRVNPVRSVHSLQDRSPTVN